MNQSACIPAVLTTLSLKTRPIRPCKSVQRWARADPEAGVGREKEQIGDATNRKEESDTGKEVEGQRYDGLVGSVRVAWHERGSFRVGEFDLQKRGFPKWRKGSSRFQGSSHVKLFEFGCDSLVLVGRNGSLREVGAGGPLWPVNFNVRRLPYVVRAPRLNAHDPKTSLTHIHLK
jgi:hypothetical protein